MSIYPGSLSKEDFKTALTCCSKKAWVWHSLDNFKQMLVWQKAQKLLYLAKEGIAETEDYQSNSASIDLFALYSELSLAEQADFQTNWENPEGFIYSKFQGEQIEDGNEVGEKARIYWKIYNQKHTPHLKIKDFSNILDFDQAVKETQKLFKSTSMSRYSYLFEPAFSSDENHLRTRCDVLYLKPDKHVEIIEIKATSQVKLEHFFDLAYQIFVLEKNGLVVDNVYLGHLRENFILGIDSNLESRSLKERSQTLFEESPQVSFVEAQAALAAWKANPPAWERRPLSIEEELNAFFDFDQFLIPEGKRQSAYRLFDAYRDLAKDHFLENLVLQLATWMSMPAAFAFQKCHQKICETKLKLEHRQGQWSWKWEFPYCAHVVPWFDQTRENIFNLTGAANFSNAKKAQIYWETNLVYFDDITSLRTLERTLAPAGKNFFLPHHFRHFEIYQKSHSPLQKWNPQMAIAGFENFVQKNLALFQQFPVYMYDFETVKWAVPRFHFSKGYQQIPFQYSIDVLTDQKYDYHFPQTLAHYDFLAAEPLDPRPEFLTNFLTDIFRHGPGIYVAYNDAFEKTVLKYAAVAFPQLKPAIYYVVQNTYDLMTFFKGKKDLFPWFMVYHPEFHGSYSIKKTQPALDPSFSYADLKINKGDKASQVFREFVDGLIPLTVWKEHIYPDLLVYCNRDTLAMVVILQQIQQLYQKWEEENFGKKI